MLNRKMFVFFTFLFASISCYGMSISGKIYIISPDTGYGVRKSIASAVRKCSIEENLILAIMKVESDFQINAHNRASRDYGLMQINEWHVLRAGLSKTLLLTSADYNVEHGCRILGWFLNRYASVEEAVSRYNCGTRRGCPSWTSVRKYKKRVLRYRGRLDDLDI